MKFVPEQDFIQYVSTQKYEFSMLDWFGGVFHPTSINFSLISNVCTFELQFQFLNVFSNFEFRFNHKYFLWMKKAPDHVLQQRRTRYTRYDRENLRKPSERKGYCKKGQRREVKGEEHCKKDQIRRREGLDG